MHYLPNIIFATILVVGIGFFVQNIKKIIRNIKLGKSINRSDNAQARLKNMALIALGQSKMVKRPVAGILHILVYAGFIIINIEVIEIIIDGLFGTHRILSFAGGFYSFLIGTFEILAVLVFASVIIFWMRRMVLQIPRFWNKEMKGWPKNDALNILYFEMILMSLFLVMNASDYSLQQLDVDHYIKAGSFPVSHFIATWLPQNIPFLEILERTTWWLHIVGI